MCGTKIVGPATHFCVDFDGARRTIRALIRPAPTRKLDDRLQRSRCHRCYVCVPGKVRGSVRRSGTPAEAERVARRGRHAPSHRRRAGRSRADLGSEWCASSHRGSGRRPPADRCGRYPPADRGRGPARRRAGAVTVRSARSARHASGVHRRVARARASLVHLRLRSRGRFRAGAFRAQRKLVRLP